jgi:ABC-type antimicrobial peptide transport system permease subunit
LGKLGQEAAVSRKQVVIEGDIIDPSDATLDPAAVQAAIELAPDFVSVASPVIFRYLRLDERLVQFRAADLADWTTVHHLSLVDGRWPDGPAEIAISDGVLSLGDWRLGSVMTIFGSDFEVSGVVQFEGTAFASLWMDLPVAQSLFSHQRGYQFMMVEIAGGADADEARAALGAHPQIADRYEVFFEDNYARRNTKSLADIQGTARAVGLIALLAIILGSYNATSLNMAEHQRQIGILRVVGFKPGAVRLLLLVQALLQSLAGFGLGLLVAIAFVAYQQSGPQLYAYGWPLAFSLTLEIVAVGLFLTLGLAGLGALVATRSMLATSPVEALAA